VTLWRCPHCATPQPETARCWVCKRSSTSCGTCRHFRSSVAVQLGYCGLDRRRLPLVGDEIRPCWEAWPATAEDAVSEDAAAAPALSRAFDFVPLGEAVAVPVGASAPSAPTATLWGDATDS
jgi:hypothetical protein